MLWTECWYTLVCCEGGGKHRREEGGKRGNKGREGGEVEGEWDRRARMRREGEEAEGEERGTKEESL